VKVPLCRLRLNSPVGARGQCVPPGRKASVHFMQCTGAKAVWVVRFAALPNPAVARVFYSLVCNLRAGGKGNCACKTRKGSKIAGKSAELSAFSSRFHRENLNFGRCDARTSARLCSTCRVQLWL
tara:strand:+ start:3341 stop:3715 length:375 start_codon:yes stop_codon:yes gene_type:complete